MSADDILGQATQDQELAGIRDTWRKAHPTDSETFVQSLEEALLRGNTGLFREIVNNEPWRAFIARCAAAGLRQAMLSEVKEER